LKSNNAFFFVLLLGFFYGLNMVVNRSVLGQIHPITLTAIRLCLCAVLQLILLIILPDRHIPTNPKLWLKAGVWGIVGTCITMSMFVYALQYMSSGVEALVSSVNPVITLALAFFFLKDEKMTKRKIAGALIALAGVMIIVSQDGNGLGEFALTDWRGYALLTIGMLAYSLSVIFARRHLKDEDTLEVSTIGLTVAGACLALYASFTVGFDLSHMQTNGYFILLYLILIGGTLTFYIELAVLQRYGAVVSSQISYTIPVFATALGALFLDEQITTTLIAGMGGIFLGLRFMN
jgi:drug/metabolite transporter (DMT)-like permease